jgi:hypothetical protein
MVTLESKRAAIAAKIFPRPQPPPRLSPTHFCENQISYQFRYCVAIRLGCEILERILNFRSRRIWQRGLGALAAMERAEQRVDISSQHLQSTTRHERIVLGDSHQPKKRICYAPTTAEFSLTAQKRWVSFNMANLSAVHFVGREV